MKLEPLKPIVIALDPGKHTGICVWRRKDEKIIFSGTTDFYSVQLFITRSFKDRSEVTIFVELPPNMLYARNESAIRYEELRIMHSVGGNVREARLLAMCLTARGYTVHLVPPVHAEKWKQKHFTLHTGSRKRTSEHERDAVRLAVEYANWRPKPLW